MPVPARLERWPAAVNALVRRIELLEVEASFVTCGVARAERLRQEARRLAVELEALKRGVLAAEAGAVVEAAG